MITSKNLLPLLAKACGLPVDLVSEEVQADGRVLVIWTTQLPPNEMRFAPDPPLLISADRETMTWAEGPPENPFTLKDLAESNPAEETNRHPLTQELALRLREQLLTTSLMSPSGAAALVAILDRLPMRSESAAALIASATGQNFWALLKHAIFAHRYRSHGSESLAPPYSMEEEKEARRVLSEPWFTDALRDKGKVFIRQVCLPIVANSNSGLFGDLF